MEACAQESGPLRTTCVSLAIQRKFSRQAQFTAQISVPYSPGAGHFSRFFRGAVSPSVTFRARLSCYRPRILGISPLDHVTNRAILLKAKTDSIAVIVRRYRLRWLGHVGRMRSAAPLPDGRWMSDRVPLRLLSAWLDGPRPVGRSPSQALGPVGGW